MKLKLDLHVHTSRSPDAFTTFPDVVDAVRQKGLDGVAVTDHDVVCSFSSKEIIIVPGIEVSSNQGHVLGLGSTQPIPSELSPEHTMDLMKRMGYVVVAPHPYSWLSRGLDPRLLRGVDAVETVNAKAFPFGRSRRLAEEAARALNLPMVGGSDSHLPQTIGDAYTVIEVEDTTLEAIVMAIQSGRTTPMGHPTGMAERLRRSVAFLGSGT